MSGGSGTVVDVKGPAKVPSAGDVFFRARVLVRGTGRSRGRLDIEGVGCRVVSADDDDEPSLEKMDGGPSSIRCRQRRKMCVFGRR